MVSDEKNRQQENDRERLLDEIRRRAEEAELKRIEDEERSAGTAPGQVPEEEAPSPFPSLPPIHHSPTAQDDEREQHGRILRERLTIALGRRRPEKARELLLELEALDPMDPSIAEFRGRLVVMLEQIAAEPPPEPDLPPALDSRPEPEDEPEPEQTLRAEEVREQVATLFETAQSLYEQERYEQALQALDELLLLDSANDEALEFHQRVEKASRLAELIRTEEARHKAEQPVPVAPAPEPPASSRGSDADFWGAPPTDETSSEGMLSPDGSALIRKARAPLLDRAASRVSKIRIPVKPLITGAVVIVVLLIAYMVIDMLVNAVVPPDRVLYVTAPLVTTGGPDLHMHADALADDLIRDLGSIAQIRVLGTPTAVAARNRNIDPLRMARMQGAGFFLGLQVGLDADRLTLKAALYDTLAPAAVWQTSVESTLRDLPRHRIWLARQILEAMEISIPESDDLLVVLPRGADHEGYATYLRGRALLLEGGDGDGERALDILQQSIREDSTLGEAWAALAWANALSIEADVRLQQERVPTVLSCVQRALMLGSRGAETFRAWALAEFLNTDYAKSVDRFEEAVALSPSDAESARRLAVALTMNGRPDDAINAAKDAVAVDPLNPASHIIAGLVHQFRGEFRDAAAAYQRALREDRDNIVAAELHADVLVYLQRSEDALVYVTDIAARRRDDPAAFYRLGRVAQAAGRPREEWMNAFQRASTLLDQELRVQPDRVSSLMMQALTQTRLGAFKAALGATSRAMQLAPHDAETLYAAARVYALQKDTQQALAVLSQAIDLRYDLRRIVDMDLFNLRGEQDFQQTVTRGRQ